MDNDTYDDRTNIKFLKQNEVNELQVTINRNIVERIEELEDKRPSKVDDQVDIKLMKQDEWSEHINQLLEGIDTILEENDKKSTGLDIATRLLRNDSQILRKEFDEFKEETVIRLDQEIENRTKAFERIKELEDYKETYNEKHQTNKNYSFERRIKILEDYRQKIYLKLERHDDILVVHRNQNDTQRKNYLGLRKVFDETVIPLIEGKHGE
tara:strand:+ start:173 stop:805 length:633 start_codon:yes stop_codon:yes gene_type:complete